MYDQGLWNGVLNSLGKFIDEKLIATWLKPAKIAANSGDDVAILVPNKFYKNWLEKNYLTQICAVLKDEYGIESRVSVAVMDEKAEKKPAAAPQPSAKTVLQLDVTYTFNNFVSGNSNNFAYNAALAVAEGNFNIYNPLYIYGGTGLGKTHLMYAIANKIKERYPKMSILYMDSDKFSNEVLYTLRTGDQSQLQERIMSMRNRFRAVDLFMLDDIQFLKTRVRTMEIFFNIFNDLHISQKQIILTSDESPQVIDMEERMRSRFASGFQAEIHPPSTEERVAILMQKAYELQIPADEQVAFYLAENVATSNVRELIGALKRLSLYASVHNTAMTIELAETALRDSGQLKKANVIVTPQQLITVVSETYSVKLSDLVSKKRTKSIVLPRQVAMYLMKDRLGLSLKEIGTHFGGRDHSTVKYAVDSIRDQLAGDEFLKDIVTRITRKTFG